MKYTKAEAVILLAGIVKSIKRKWELLASGEFKGMEEIQCALCDACAKVRKITKKNDSDNCDYCPLVDRKGRTCIDDEHVYGLWGEKVCEVMRNTGYSFKRAVNDPSVVKFARRVLAALRRAEIRMRKVVDA